MLFRKLLLRIAAIVTAAIGTVLVAANDELRLTVCEAAKIAVCEPIPSTAGNVP